MSNAPASDTCLKLERRSRSPLHKDRWSAAPIPRSFIMERAHFVAPYKYYIVDLQRNIYYYLLINL